MIFSALVVNGRPILSPEDRKQVDAFYRNREGKTVWLMLDDKRPPRTLSQNAYYFGVVLEYISNETGDDVESTHESFKEQFCPRFFDENGVEMERSTTRLTTKEFAKYIDQIIAFVGSELGISIPSPSQAT